MKWISPTGIVLTGLALVLTGCGSKSEVVYKQWHRPRLATDANKNANFRLYCEAANQAAALAPDSVSRSTFTPGDRSALVAKLSPALQQVEKASRGKCEFAVSIPRTLDDHKRSQAWLLIGRTLAWRIEQATQKGDWARAVSWTLVAYKFGYDLAQGGRAESSLGFVIAGEARKALAPHLAKLEPNQLDRLATGLTEIAANAAPRSDAIEAEGDHMLYFVQWIQDSYRKKDWGGLEKAMYKDGREAIDFLKGLDEEKVPAYFASMAQEAETITSDLVRDAKLPLPARAPVDWDKLPDRPWKRFSKHFFRFAETLLAIGDEFDARTRLLVLNSRVIAAMKRTGAAPKVLPGEAWLKSDPYSKSEFVYRATGSDYILYSVGQDMRDDGGDTDEAGLRPDLKLDDGFY